jgi:putative tryptophan/tyrosine transport system substrate-binding protein
MRRREFIALLGGAAAGWPMAASAQQPGIRRIGVLVNLSSDNPEAQARIGAFLQGLQEFGWSIGRNVRIEYRWASNLNNLPRYAAELVALAPDVVLANANPSVDALQKVSRTMPIVFVATTDPVGSGLVESLARPGGNATGFMSYEFSIAGKWLELLKQIAPGVTRVAVLRDATLAVAMSLFAAMQAVAPSLGVEIIPVNMRNAGEIEQSVKTFARSPNGGLIPVSSATAVRHRELILTLAARHKLPAVYWERFFVVAGGLMSYGPDLVEQFQQAAGYVDRILKGEKPADLPVQTPTKFQLVINLKTARSLGLDVPPTLLARADEVIE